MARSQTGIDGRRRGLFRAIREGRRFPRGVPVEVCTDTAARLTAPPYAETFVLTDADGRGEAEARSCAPGCC